MSFNLLLQYSVRYIKVSGIEKWYLELDCIFINLTFILVVYLCVVEHGVDVLHEVIDGLVFPALLLLLETSVSAA